jgi:hypothetical protein
MKVGTSAAEQALQDENPTIAELVMPIGGSESSGARAWLLVDSLYSIPGLRED